VLPESGWITVRIHGAEDVAEVVDLFRMNYDRSWETRAV
jgi:luciferase-like monooxygenase